MVASKKKSEFSAQLAAIKKAWAGARDDAGGGDFQGLPEGKYIAWLTGEMNQSQNGRLQIAWTHHIAQGDIAGQKQMSWDGLETPDNLIWTARKFARLGYEVDKVDAEEIPDILDDINAAPKLVQITIKEKDGFTNTYVNRLLDPDQYEGLTDAPGTNGGATKTATAASKPSGGSGAATKPKGKGKAKGKAPAASPDYAAMGQKADDGDDAAVTALEEVCEKRGVDPNDFGTWAEVGEHLNGGSSDIGADAADEPAAPKKGDNVWFVSKGKAMEGMVQSISNGVAKVKGPNGVVEVAVEKLEVLEVPSK